MRNPTRLGFTAALLAFAAAPAGDASVRPGIELSSGASSVNARLYHSKPCSTAPVCRRRPRLTVRAGGSVRMETTRLQRVTVRLGHVSTRPYRQIGDPIEARLVDGLWRVRLPRSLRGVNVVDITTTGPDGFEVEYHSMLRVNR